MRNPTPFVSLNDVPRELFDGGDLGPCPEGGLCWPDDPLDKVIGYVSMLEDGFLEDLELDLNCSLSGSRRHRHVRDGGNEFSRRLPQGQDMEPDTGALVALREADDPGGWKTSACHVFDTVPEGLPPPQAPSLSCSPTSSGRRSLPSTSGEAEPQEHASEDDDGLRWTVLRKPHQRRATRRRHGWPSWTLALPLAFTSAAAHDDSSDNDDKGTDFELMSYCHNDGGGLPRPGAGRQRQRRQGSKHEKDKTCTHCRASDTPQWRAGPAGNSTLCNACGIRYKMGKLFPEYRPSNSPEFRSNEHSNRHRNVERIRQRKKLKVMAPEVLLNPHAAADDKLLLQVCKYET